MLLSFVVADQPSEPYKKYEAPLCEFSILRIYQVFRQLNMTLNNHKTKPGSLLLDPEAFFMEANRNQA